LSLSVFKFLADLEKTKIEAVVNRGQSWRSRRWSFFRFSANKLLSEESVRPLQPFRDKWESVVINEIWLKNDVFVPIWLQFSTYKEVSEVAAAEHK